MEHPQEIERLLQEKLDHRFGKRLRWVDEYRGEERVVMQNYYDGRVRLISDHRVSAMTKDIDNSNVKRGKKGTVPPAFRRVRDDEAREIWRLQTYKDYFEWMGVWAQDRVEKAAKQLVGKNVPDKEILAAMPPSVRRQFRKIMEVKYDLDESQAEMRKYSGRATDRPRSGHWRIGRLMHGYARTLEDYLRSIAIKARQSRDKDFMARRDGDAILAERLKLQVRREAVEQLETVGGIK